MRWESLFCRFVAKLLIFGWKPSDKKILCHSLHLFQVMHEPGDDYMNVDEATALGSKVNSSDLDTSEEETGLSDGQVNFPA